MDAKTNNPKKILQYVPGAEPSARIDAWWGLVLAVIVLAVFLMVVSPDPFWRIFVFVLDGIGVTVETSVISFVLILVLGLIGGLGRIARQPFIHWLATIYVEVIRGIPLLVQLMAWYFAVPPLIQTLGGFLGIEALKSFQVNQPIAWAIMGITFCYGAYMSEIYRAGIQSIQKGQMEAARSLGMTQFQAMRFVILPQAFRVILPPVGNEFISLLKDSSLISTFAIEDLTRRGREFGSTSAKPIETWIMVALLYLVLTLFSARIVAWLERKTKMER
jgi:polar amino acid transport system permease protein